MGTFAKDSALDDQTPGQGKGGVSTGIGVGNIQSGKYGFGTPTVVGQGSYQFPASTVDFASARIGGSQGVVSATFVAGSGYTDGVYIIEPTPGTGGLLGKAGGAKFQVTVSGGLITAVVVLNAGGGYTSAPTVPVTALGAGTGASITPTIGTAINKLRNTAADNKGGRYLQATAAVAIGAAVSGGYINRSNRAMVTGDWTWAVAP